MILNMQQESAAAAAAAGFLYHIYTNWLRASSYIFCSDSSSRIMWLIAGIVGLHVVL